MFENFRDLVSPPVHWKMLSHNGIKDLFLDEIIHDPIKLDTFESIRIESRTNLLPKNTLESKFPINFHHQTYIGHKFCDIYYHWLFDIIPRLLYSLEILGEHAKISLPRPIFRFQQEWLDMAAPNLKLSFFPEEIEYLEGSIIVPSSSTTGTIVSPWAIKSIRHLAQKIKPSENNKKIYLRRQGNISRKIVNEAELEDLLKSEGFIALDPALFSVREQIALFKGANTIVSAHGSALTNLIFCEPNTSVIEIFGPYCGETCYPRIANLVNLHHLGVQTKNIAYFGVADWFRHFRNENDAPFHFRVDTKIIRKAIDAINDA